MVVKLNEFTHNDSINEKKLKPIRTYNPHQYAEKKQELLEEFGSNKTIPTLAELPVLIALSHFPELKETPIRFIFSKSEFAFASRPDLFSVLKKRKKREYLIVLSSQSSKVPDALLFQHLPFNAQIGILGHELCHTVYYLDKSPSQLIFTGISYFNSKYRVKFENDTDKEAIRRGLGWQLLEFAQFHREHPQATQEYLRWLNRYYLTPSQILEYIRSIPDYS